MKLVDRGRAAITCHMSRKPLNAPRADHFSVSQGFDETVNLMTAGSFAPFTAWPRSPPEPAPMKQDKWSRSERNGLEHGVHLPEGAAWRSNAASLAGRPFTSSLLAQSANQCF